MFQKVQLRLKCSPSIMGETCHFFILFLLPTLKILSELPDKKSFYVKASPTQVSCPKSKYENGFLLLVLLALGWAMKTNNEN